MEADLRQYYGIDYRDRYRHDDDGTPLLTFRQLYVYVSQLPPDSRVKQIEEHWWSPEAHLLDELRMTLFAAYGGKKVKVEPHPQRPGRAKKHDKQAALAAHDPRRIAEYRALSAERKRQKKKRKQQADAPEEAESLGQHRVRHASGDPLVPGD